MSVARPVLCVFLITVFFGGINYCRCKCNYAEILSSYKAVILSELQRLNLNVPYTTFKEKDRCPSGKVKHILRSIYGMTQLLKCPGKGKQQSEIEKTVERMEQLIRVNCKQENLERRLKNGTCKAGQGVKGRKRKKKKILKALIQCWQKLQTVYIP